MVSPAALARVGKQPGAVFAGSSVSSWAVIALFCRDTAMGWTRLNAAITVASSLRVPRRAAWTADGWSMSAGIGGDGVADRGIEQLLFDSRFLAIYSTPERIPSDLSRPPSHRKLRTQ